MPFPSNDDLDKFTRPLEDDGGNWSPSWERLVSDRDEVAYRQEGLALEPEWDGRGGLSLVGANPVCYLGKSDGWTEVGCDFFRRHGVFKGLIPDAEGDGVT